MNVLPSDDIVVSNAAGDIPQGWFDTADKPEAMEDYFGKSTFIQLRSGIIGSLL